MVYNSESDSCREVTVTPNAAWGGEGRYFPCSEGCRVGPWWGLWWAWSSRAPVGGGGLGPGPRDPEADHWPRRHPSRPHTAISGWDGRGRNGCGTMWDNSWIECFWPLAVWAVVSATGICTGSQPSPPAATRSHRVPCRLVLHHLVLHHLVSPYLVPCHLVPHHLDPPPRTRLLLLAHIWVPGRMTTWRYVGSTWQPGAEGSFMSAEGPAGRGEKPLETVSQGACLWSP